MPYGVWRCADGTEVLFNRRYDPMRRRLPDGSVQGVDPGERIDFVEQAWFFDDGTSPDVDRATADLCRRVLKEWGVG